MAARCDICGKGVMFGHRVSHAHNLTKRKWKPNLHKITIMKNGKKVRVKVCTKCLRKVQKVV
ncbi:MAG: 50S ribosomal protein L28 [Candidatus Hydrothermota bacterium]|nr:MAG: 50S ribosomal protein L28 [Candidatus Hydrothermae bacterium]